MSPDSLPFQCLLTYFLMTQIMGYLSGASPHIKSGAVSVLSALIYRDASICVSMPDLIPSLLPLLQGRSLEVIKVSISKSNKDGCFSDDVFTNLSLFCIFNRLLWAFSKF